MDIQLQEIDFSRVEVVSYDLGYTVLGINAQAIARLIKKHLGWRFTPTEILNADRNLRRRYSRTADQNPSIQFSHFSDVLYDMLAYLSKDLIPMAHTSEINSFKRACDQYHQDFNFFSLIYHDALAALELLFAAGVPMIVISNAHGTLHRDLEHFGLSKYFRLIVDSGTEGIRKPDAEIFIRAMDRMGTQAEKFLHIGDSYAADIKGACAVGMQSALYDPDNMHAQLNGGSGHFRNHIDLAQRIIQSRSAPR